MVQCTKAHYRGLGKKALRSLMEWLYEILRKARLHFQFCP